MFYLLYNLQNQAEILKFKFRIILELENIVVGERVPLLKFCFVSPIIDVLHCYSGFIYQTQETLPGALFTKLRSLFKFHRYSIAVFFFLSIPDSDPPHTLYLALVSLLSPLISVSYNDRALFAVT